MGIKVNCENLHRGAMGSKKNLDEGAGMLDTGRNFTRKKMLLGNVSEDENQSA